MEHAPAYLAQSTLEFNETLERIGEVGLVLLAGAMVPWTQLPWEALWFVPLFLVVIRPVSVAIGRTSP
jgi:NhaP-type Na+/H+ or K+/H+ antiporter